MRARSVFRCAPGTRELWRAQPAPVQDALAAAWIRQALTGDEPAPDALPPGVWERARGMVWTVPGYGPDAKKGGRA